MKIDLEHLHYWMSAVRESHDKHRTLDAFWSGQIKSKVWLIDNLSKYVDGQVSVDIYGGWVGVLSSLLFQSSISCKHIRSIDIDPSCESIAKTMNKLEEMQGRFTAITADMCITGSTADVVINTSCEHLTQNEYNRWLDQITDSLIVLQSNNYEIDEHTRISRSVEEFQEQSNISVLFSDTLRLPLYDRYMLIGRR